MSTGAKTQLYENAHDLVRAGRSLGDQSLVDASARSLWLAMPRVQRREWSTYWREALRDLPAGDTE